MRCNTEIQEFQLLSCNWFAVKISFRQYSFQSVYSKSYKIRLIVDNYRQQIRAGRALMSVAGSVCREYTEVDRGRPSPPPQLPVCLGARCKGDRMHRWHTAIKSSNCFTKRMWMSNTRASAARRVPLRASRSGRSSWSSNEKAVLV